MTLPQNHGLNMPIAQWVWQTRYASTPNGEFQDDSMEATWRRVARAVAAVESVSREHWEQRFYRLMHGFRFVPGGRILAGAGRGCNSTLFNCFVMGPLSDDADSTREAIHEAQLTMQAGGGVGYDFSSLAPKGMVSELDGSVAPGPVSALQRWDAMCSGLLSGGGRRGAMMASLRCDHPDIEAFIDAKRRQGALLHFNLSVQVSDEFMRALDSGLDWPLVFPLQTQDADAKGDLRWLHWPGYDEPVGCRVLRQMPARELWSKIMLAAYETAEPGVLFVDRINEYNNLGYREYISTTNPCAEIPLPSYGACNLGSINLTRFVRAPFSAKASFDLQGIREAADSATRLLDNVIDCSRFPLEAQAREAIGSRRIGLGITGLADALILMGLSYADEVARQRAAQAMQTICHQAYRTSIGLAKEKGSFPFLNRSEYLRSRFIQALPADIRAGIKAQGIRNSHLIAIAPAGTISLLANNVSSGIEPVFDFYASRRVRNAQGEYQNFEVQDYALQRWVGLKGGKEKLPPQFITAHELDAQAHLLMQAALQPYVDNAISKTINIPEDYPYADFYRLYRHAWELGVKGCTTYRARPTGVEILRSAHCCHVDFSG